MKKSLYTRIIVGIVVLTTFSSCKDYLDFEYIFNQDVTLDSVFMQKQYTEQWLADTYRGLREDGNIPVAGKGRMPVNFLGDDMYYSDWETRGNSYINMKTVKYTENSSEYPDNWFKCFNVIRKASILIHNVDKNEEMTPDEIIDHKGQARFIRAYMYWTLLRKYGPIMILPDEGVDYTLHYEDLVMPRNTYEECAEYIASEMALAAQEMVIPRSSREVARATPGAALAMRARAYLYAASPLFNGNDSDWAKQLTDDTGKRLISPQRNEVLWAKAAAAAKEVMDLGTYRLYTAPIRTQTESPAAPKTVIPPFDARYSNTTFPDGWANIDPFESYRSVFNGQLTAYDNPELIFTRGANRSTDENSILDMVLHQVPNTLFGWNSHGATMKQANAYYMKDGSDHYAYEAVDPSAVDKPANMQGYVEEGEEIDFLRTGVAREFRDREPRYYASIAFNGSYWEGMDAPTSGYPSEEERQIFYYRDNSNGMQAADNEHYLKTGIGIKKFYHPRDYFTSQDRNSGSTRPKADIDIRYAEVLLIYAEALNELSEPHTVANYTGDGTITISRDINEMRKGIKPVRMRGGVPDFEEDVYASYDKFLKALKRERQIELFAENHRYYDLRRWMDVAKEEAIPVWGYNMKITSAQKDLWYIPVQIPSLPNLFLEKTYLWPIKHDELRKNPRLTQNPGWTYYF